MCTILESSFLPVIEEEGEDVDDDSLPTGTVPSPVDEISAANFEVDGHRSPLMISLFPLLSTRVVTQ